MNHSTHQDDSPAADAGAAPEVFRDIVERAEDSIYVLDTDCRVLYANPFACSWLGSSAKEIAGRHLRDLFARPVAERMAASVARVIECGESLSIEAPIQTPATTGAKPATRWLHTRLIPRKDAAGRVHSVIGISRDITNRRQAETEAREGEKFIRAIINAVPAMVLYVDKDGYCRFLNESCAGRLGWSVEEAVGKPLAEVRGRHGHKSFPEHTQRVLAGETVHFHYEAEIEGEIRQRDCSFLPHFADDGQVAGYFMVINDVTEQWEAEQALRHSHEDLEQRVAERTQELRNSEQRFRTIVETVPGVVWMTQTDAAYTPLYLSDSVEQMFGYSREDFLSGKVRFVDLVNKEDFEPLEAVVGDALSQRKPYTIEMRFRRADGDTIWIQEMGAGVHDETGQIEYLIGTLTEITERKTAEARLRDSEQRFRLMVEAMPLAVCITRRSDGRMLYANPRFEQLMGEPPGGWAGKQSLSYYAQSADRPKFLEQLSRKGRVSDYHQTLHRADDGRLLHVETNLEPIRFEGEDALVCGFHDITDRVQMEQQLRGSEQRYRGVVETAGSVIICLDADRRIWEWNQEAERIIGYTREEALGQDAYELLLISTVREEFAPRRDRLMAGEAYRNVEIPIRTREGRPIGTISIGQDITEMRRVQQALAESEDLYRSLIRTAGSLILCTDANRRIWEWNDEAERVLGYTREQMIGKDSYEVLAPPGQREYFLKRREAVLAGQTLGPVEVEMATADGGQRTVLWNSSVLRDADEQVIGIIGIGQDVTETRRVQQALADSEERLRAFVSALPDIAFVLDEDGRYLEVLGAEPELLIQPERTLKGRRVHDVLPRTVADLCIATVRETLASGQSQRVEYELEVPAGRRLFEGRTSPMQAAGKGRRMVVWLARDITEHKQALEDLRESEERYRLHFENVSDVISSIDTEFRITSVSPSIQAMLGYTPEELVGKRIDEVGLLPPQFMARAFDEIARVQSGESIYDSAYELRRKDGGIVFAEMNPSPLIKDGRPVGVMVVARNVTERKMAEMELRRSEATRAALISALPDLIFRFSADGTFLDFVSTQGDKPAMPPEQFLGRNLQDVLPPDLARRTIAHIRLALEGKVSVFEYPLNVPMPDGPIHYYEARYVAISENEVIAVTRNITDRKRAEADLMEYQQRLRSLASELSLTEQRERRRIAADLHDRIGQALALCRLKLKVLRDRATDEEGLRAVTETRKLIEQTIRDTRSLMFQISPPVLYELGFEPAVEWLSEQIVADHGLPVDLSIEDHPKPLDDDVSFVLFASLRELLLNVVKHAKATKALVDVDREGDFIRIRVSDDGEGFDAHHRRAGDTSSQSYGLFSISERLGPLGGKLDIDSQPGRGTTATLTAPLAGGDFTTHEQSGDSP